MEVAQIVGSMRVTGCRRENCNLGKLPMPKMTVLIASAGSGGRVSVWLAWLFFLVPILPLLLELLFLLLIVLTALSLRMAGFRSVAVSLVLDLMVFEVSSKALTALMSFALPGTMVNLCRAASEMPSDLSESRSFLGVRTRALQV